MGTLAAFPSAMNATTQTLGDLAASIPAATRVFLRHGLDFCCRGQRTLADACAQAGLDAVTIANEIEAERARGGDVVSWETRSQAELADHIERHYHAALRRDVPPLIEAAIRVERVHADKPDVPRGLAAALERFWFEMQEHMHKEEAVLFPMLRQGARGQAVFMPVRVMQHEHDMHGENLEELREITGNYEIPEGACGTWRALYEGLAALQRDLMEHIHLENNVLFLRATRAAE